MMNWAGDRPIDISEFEGNAARQFRRFHGGAHVMAILCVRSPEVLQFAERGVRPLPVERYS